MLFVLHLFKFFVIKFDILARSPPSLKFNHESKRRKTGFNKGPHQEGLPLKKNVFIV